uniref:Down syndrome cell adhesion molecule-like protein Dscam2 isoform X2 n=1 Tax=Dermatophagoides pteronyssinus TaxID=6956 RepID=A0A6P6Y412_DERPT|nr:Down syndrome cell adhesion molecule-like protein Dscam2 isoform X2 [Dermatophagoides pteronyssinus]
MASNYAQTVVQAMKMMSNLMMTKIKQRSNWSYYDRKFIINNDLLKTTYLSSSSSFATTSTSIFSSLSLSNLRKFPLYSIIIQNMILMIIMITTMLPLPNSCLLLNTADHIVDHIGPYFIREPPQQVIFSNNTGAVIYCSVNGNPMPKVYWETKNDQIITDVTGIRHVRHDNALIFQQFSTKDYRPDLHSQTYRCCAENSVGIIKSRYVQVRAVVEQRFVIEVYDEFVTAGNSALLRCHIPAFMRDLLDIIGWIEGSSNHILPDTNAFVSSSSSTSSSSSSSSSITHRQNSDKYRILYSGELLINKVEPADALKSFRCQVKHRMTNEKFLSSNSGRLFVSELITSQPPRIIDTNRVIIAEEGSSAEIVCLAQGYPEPTYTWYKNTDLISDRIITESSSSTLSGLMSNNYLIPRFRILTNSILIEKVNQNDAGLYRCIVNNSLGSELAETQLIVRSPLNVQIGLPIIRIELGHSLTLNCTVSGGPIKAIEWLHNGRPISNMLTSSNGGGTSSTSTGIGAISSSSSSSSNGSGGFRIRLISREVLHISKVTRTDHGMYQCVAFNDFDSAQAQVQLQLGDNAPQLLSVFSEQTLQPGQPLSLKCIASGNPIPQVLWHVYDKLPIPDHLARYRIGDYVTRDSLLVSYVNISSILPEDGGLYTCQAMNDVATVQHTARINVYGRPTIRRMPNITAVAGESISITCPVGGYPIDSIVWERDSVRLPYNHRQKVFTNGTLTVNELERVTDEGIYTCIARNKEDVRSSAKTSFSLRVFVRPVIEPFKFPQSLHQSQRYNLLCTVVKGDPPIKVEWYKDGKKLSIGSFPHTNIIHVTDYSVTLAFESVQPDHRGNYTCVASNGAGSSSHSATMIIHVPPRWRIEPTDMTVVKGHNAIIDCDTDAYPEPVITWSRAEGLDINNELPSNFKPINSNGHYRSYENGSLVIHNSHKSDTGYYMCAASNGIGPGISKVIKITVNVAATFETKFRTETVHRGLEARIKCSANGDKPVTISWFKDKAPLMTTEDGRYDLIETIMNEGIKSELLIRNADRRDGGLYTCLASNSFGHDDTNIQLIVQEPPDPPSDIKIIERDGRSIRIQWSTPYSGNSPLTHYIVQHKPESEKLSSHYYNLTLVASENSVSLNGLQPVTTYQVRIIAINDLGQSEPSDVMFVQTDEETPGGPPLHLKAIALTSTSIKVSWKTPRKELQFGFIRGYYIGYRLIQSTSSMDGSSSSSSGSTQQSDFIYKTLEVKGKDNVEECIISELKRASRYEIIVQAFNSKGAGPSSEPVHVKTLEFDPPTSPTLQVTEVTFNFIRLSWSMLSDQIISGYILHYKRESSDWRELKLSNIQTFTHENLRCGTRYQYYLVGFNSAGKGDPSQVVSARTDGTSPVAPDKNSLLSVNYTMVTIYLDSFHDGGCKINNFEVMYKTDRLHNWTPLTMSDQRTIVLNDLLPGHKYQIRVTAFNEAGSTEAEYHFITPMSSLQNDQAIILMGSRSTSSVPFYADVLVVVPSVISFVVIVVLLSLVYIIFTRKPRHTNNIYGNFNDQNKFTTEGNESVIMGELEAKYANNLNGGFNTNTDLKGYPVAGNGGGCVATMNQNVVHFQSPYAMTNIQEKAGNEERYPLNHLNMSPMKAANYSIEHDGIYATVKRTPRPPRSDVHIYQFPRGSTMATATTVATTDDIINLDSESFDSSTPNSGGCRISNNNMGNGGGGLGSSSSTATTNPHTSNNHSNNQNTANWRATANPNTTMVTRYDSKEHHQQQQQGTMAHMKKMQYGQNPLFHE